jgi:small subunit ribosomal protein S6
VARLYDLMLMLDPNAPEERQSEVLASAEKMIESAGTLVGKHDWGVRRMSFEIDHRPEAAYHLFQFESESNEMLERLDHSLKIADGVLRFRVIRLKPGSPPPPTPRQEAPRTRERPQDTRVAPRAAADSQREDSEPEAGGDAAPDAASAETPPAEAPPTPDAAPPAAEPAPEGSEQAPA